VADAADAEPAQSWAAGNRMALSFPAWPPPPTAILARVAIAARGMAGGLATLQLAGCATTVGGAEGLAALLAALAVDAPMLTELDLADNALVGPTQSVMPVNSYTGVCVVWM
jgi:hypothetical protein